MKSLLFLLFFTTAVIAQVTPVKDSVNIAEDTLQLRPVVIREDFSKFKDVKIKIKSNCLNPESLTTYSEIVTLADNLPQGYLESVSFYFNEQHYSTYNSDRKKFEDSEFEVVLYAVNTDGTPGERIMRDEKYILIMKDHSGKAEVHFLEFSIKNHRKMFIGLRRTQPGNTNKRSFYVDCVCNAQNHLSYTRSQQEPNWAKPINCPALKMEVNFLVSHE